MDTVNLAYAHSTLPVTPTIAVIILNWNAAADTICCVQQCAAWQGVNSVVYVVDNASSGADVEQIAQACPHVHLIRNAANLGFAGGSNVGMAAALSAGCNALLLLNNDAQLAATTLQQLWHTLISAPTHGVVGPLLYSADQPPRLITAGYGNPVLHLDNRIRTLPAGETNFPVHYISGSVALIRASLLQQIGLLDERFFFSGEVADLCQRAAACGFRTLVDVQARATHNVDRSARWRSTLYTYYIVRNRFLYARNTYKQSAYGLAGLLLLGFWAFYGWLLTVKLRLTGQRTTALAVWLGTVDGVTGRFGGQNERILNELAGK